MTIFKNYAEPVVSSGSPLALGTVFASFGEVNASGINNVRDFLVGSGWSNPTLMSTGQPDGVAAVGQLSGIGMPFHRGAGGGPSQVPPSAPRLGNYDGLDFVLFDPSCDPPDNVDPTSGSLIGVPLGLSANATIAAFNTLATFNTRWTFNVGPQSLITDEFHGPVVAKLVGPSGNVDDSDSGTMFSGDGANVAVDVLPTLGGWNVYSAPAPTTGDVIKIYAYQSAFGNLRIRATLGGSGAGATFTGGNLCQEYPLLFSVYFMVACAYQFALQRKPDDPGFPGDFAGLLGGGGFVLTSALNVPATFAPSTLAITAITNTGGFTPVVVQTASAHGQVKSDRIKIAGVAGGTALNTYWWVYDAPTANTLRLSIDNKTLLMGDGTGGSGGTVLLGGIMQASVFTGDLATKTNTGTQTQVQCQGISKSSWSSPRTTQGNHGVSLPMINIGSESADAINSAGKPIMQSPYVMLRIEDDAEARVAGFLWESYVLLGSADYAEHVTYKDKYFIAWGSDNRIGKLVSSSYWFKIQ